MCVCLCVSINGRLQSVRENTRKKQKHRTNSQLTHQKERRNSNHNNSKIKRREHSNEFQITYLHLVHHVSCKMNIPAMATQWVHCASLSIFFLIYLIYLLQISTLYVYVHLGIQHLVCVHFILVNPNCNCDKCELTDDCTFCLICDGFLCFFFSFVIILPAYLSETQVILK